MELEKNTLRGGMAVSESSPVKLLRVNASELNVLREYVEALYAHDEDYDAMVHIDAGLKSLLRNEALAMPYFIQRGGERIGYVILTKYHSVEKGGLTIYIDELFVEKQYRRQGVGKDILRQITNVARQEGATTLWAQTEPHNQAAQVFFKTEGFTNNPYLNFEKPL